MREVIGQSCVVPMPRATGESEPTVLDCGAGSGRWIEQLLQEKDGYVDVSPAIQQRVQYVLDVAVLTTVAKATAVDICFDQRTPSDDDDDEDDDGRDGGVQEYGKKRWNLNQAFRTDRSEDRLRPETFDVIHSRFLADGIDASRWQAYVADLRQLLKKGGWVQMIEMIPHIQSENGRLGDDSYLNTWWLSYSRVLTQMGRNVRIGRDLERMLAHEGFERVGSRSYNIPIGTWDRSTWYDASLVNSLRTDQRSDRQLGRDNLDIVREMLVSVSMWPLVHHGRMPAAQYRSLIEGAIRELQDDSLKLYYRV